MLGLSALPSDSLSTSSQLLSRIRGISAGGCGSSSPAVLAEQPLGERLGSTVHYPSGQAFDSVGGKPQKNGLELTQNFLLAMR